MRREAEELECFLTSLSSGGKETATPENEHTRALQEATTHHAPPGTGSDYVKF